jgi:hypothetical protein
MPALTLASIAAWLLLEPAFPSARTLKQTQGRAPSLSLTLEPFSRGLSS